MVFQTAGTCSREIIFDVEGRKVKGVRFVGGCAGNAQGIARLVEGQDIDTVIARLSGIQCRHGTSCPDQLAVALTKYKKEQGI